MEGTRRGRENAKEIFEMGAKIFEMGARSSGQRNAKLHSEGRV
jgi:hypothetical protein